VLGKRRNKMENEIEIFECGASIDDPPYPYCCTLIHGSVCQAELCQVNKNGRGRRLEWD